MMFFSLPLIPFTLVSALFFRNRFFAYAFPVLLVVLKMIMTLPSPIYLFTAGALLIATAILRKIHRSEAVTVRQTFIYAALSVVIFELISNAGFFIIGGCCVGSNRLVEANLAGLIEAYRDALPFAALHLLKACALSVPLVMAASWIKSKTAAWNFARQHA